MRFKQSGRSHEGRRHTNEDAFYVAEGDDELLAMVADGMGASRSGRPAADLAVDTFADHFEKRAATYLEECAAAWWDGEHRGAVAWSAQRETERDVVYAHVVALLATRRPATLGDLALLEAENLMRLRLPVRAIEASNSETFRRSRTDRRWVGMGAAVVAAFFAGERVGVAHVGDSRAYRLRDGVLVQLTADHSLLNEYLRARPDMTPEELEALPGTVILRALGMEEEVVVDFIADALTPGDVFLLCSDGLTRRVPEAELAERLALPPEAASMALLQRALEVGADDNITVIVVGVQS